jgi:DNA-binding transcriptional regulator YiaG
MNPSTDTLPDFLRPTTVDSAPPPAKRGRGRPRKTEALPYTETNLTRHIADWQKRIGLSDQGMATYLGVPVVTFQQWARGQRTPNSSALRLIEVLQAIETFAPDLACSLKPRSPGTTNPTEAP